MISIIISSYQPDYFRALEKNIAETVGVEYEVIKIENPGLMGICEAYNKGAEQANYEYLLFVHEDVKFHTPDWGKKLINHLNIPGTGLIGVAGSDYVPAAPASWYIGRTEHQFLRLIQHSPEGGSPELTNHLPLNKHQVFALDGVFLAIKKQIFAEFGFSKTLKGFHAYDTEISLNVARKYTNFVIGDILIEHFSPGVPDKFWLDGNIAVRKQHGARYQKKVSSTIEMEVFKSFLHSYFKFHGISSKNIFSTLKFFPLWKLKTKDYWTLAKVYYQYFRHFTYFTKKYNS